MPQKKRCIKCKLVFNINYNGMYHARLVSYGYGQVVVIDISENYLPIMNDIMFWVLLLLIDHFGFVAKVVDVKMSFLYGELEEEIYREFPPGIKCR